MILTIVLDSGPLGLLTRHPGIAPVEACLAWYRRHIASGDRFVLPEIIDYKLRRELIRLGASGSIKRLGRLGGAPHVLYEPLSTPVLHVAAGLWADAVAGVTRRRGRGRSTWTSSSPHRPWPCGCLRTSSSWRQPTSQT